MAQFVFFRIYFVSPPEFILSRHEMVLNLHLIFAIHYTGRVTKQMRGAK